MHSLPIDECICASMRCAVSMINGIYGAFKCAVCVSAMLSRLSVAVANVHVYVYIARCGAVSRWAK